MQAWDHARVEAWGNAHVVARGEVTVEAIDAARVEAWDNALVVVGGEACVEAWGNVQVVKRSDRARVKLHANARIAALPRTAQEFCEHHGITVRDGCAILYKAVSPDLRAWYDNDFQYEVGGTFREQCDPSEDVACGVGLHVCHLHGAFRFGKGYYGRKFAIIECAVPLDKIVVPRANADWEVRTSELTVLREVPREEWGMEV